MYLNVNDENAILLEYFNLTTNIQCSGFNQWTVAWGWPSKADTCSTNCNFIILN
jgi:hypothetical protein